MEEDLLNRARWLWALHRQKVPPILRFLAAGGFVVHEGGRFKMGVQRTYLEHGSPHLGRHHTNWRKKAIQKIDSLTDQELMFTSPISVSRKDFEKIREQLANLIKLVSQTVKESPAEDIACLNIDLFWID